MSQALAAAQATITDNQTSHSLHCYFLLPGDAELPVLYQVERLRDGRSFSTRQVRAIQNDNVIFEALISFQIIETGLSHQTVNMPELKGPEAFEHDMLKFQQNPNLLSKRMQSKLHYHNVVDIRSAETTIEQGVARRCIWLKSDEVFSEPAMHQAALCYASDYYFLSTAVKAHGLSPANKNLRLATIDHAIWFHRQCDFNDWLLYVTESPVSDHARAFVQGKIFQRDGTLVASTTQEGLMRLRD